MNAISMSAIPVPVSLPQRSSSHPSGLSISIPSDAQPEGGKAKGPFEKTEHVYRYAVGDRVRHKDRGIGNVTEHMLDGRTVISFDSGETHRSPSPCPAPTPTPAVDSQATLTLPNPKPNPRCRRTGHPQLNPIPNLNPDPNPNRRPRLMVSLTLTPNPNPNPNPNPDPDPNPNPNPNPNPPIA